MEVPALFIRRKKSSGRKSLQMVENRREDGKVRQRVLLTLGREDELRSSGHLDALLASGSRFSEKLLLLSAFREGRLEAVAKRHRGPGLVFGRLWTESGCEAAVKRVLEGRPFGFDVERAVFATVLHRLCDPGSDRACERWMQDYAIAGADGLALQHFYRAMAWLGEPLPHEEQDGASLALFAGNTRRKAPLPSGPFPPRCTKDSIEEDLFTRRRTLFSSLSLCFFDTTSIDFEGEGGKTIGRYGHSKDHRPDLKQRVVGAVLDAEGRPVCCEMGPGNTTDVKSLLAIVKRLRERFGITQVCIVSEGGMISDETVRTLEAMDPSVRSILGARMRAVKEGDEAVLSRAGRFQVLHGGRKHAKDPSPLKVKEV